MKLNYFRLLLLLVIPFILLKILIHPIEDTYSLDTILSKTTTSTEGIKLPITYLDELGLGELLPIIKYDFFIENRSEILKNNNQISSSTLSCDNKEQEISLPYGLLQFIYTGSSEETEDYLSKFKCSEVEWSGDDSFFNGGYIELKPGESFKIYTNLIFRAEPTILSEFLAYIFIVVFCIGVLISIKECFAFIYNDGWGYFIDNSNLNKIRKIMKSRGDKEEVYISVDVEADGPIPSDYSMSAIGACVVDEPEKTFYRELKPMTDKFVPEMAAVSGLDREKLKQEGGEPEAVMRELAEWLDEICGDNKKPILVAFNATYDWMFVNWYFYHFLGQNPFGISGWDIKAYYAGVEKKKLWVETSKSKLDQKYRSELPHTHNALDDALEQAEIFRKLREGI